MSANNTKGRVLPDLKAMEEMQQRLEALEARNKELEAKASAGTGPLSVSLSDYKGSPTLSFQGGNIRPFFIGIAKAKAVLALSDTVTVLVKEGEALKAAKKGAK